MKINRFYYDCLNRYSLKNIQHLLGHYIKEKFYNNFDFVSISHSNYYVIIIASNSRVGVDVEKASHSYSRSKLLTKFEKKLLANHSFTEIWTLKESVAKYFQIGLPTISTIEILKISDSYVCCNVLINGHKFVYRINSLKYNIDDDYYVSIVFQ